MNYIYMWTAALVIIAGIVVVYERQNGELESWADALSTENAELQAELSQLRRQSWQR